MNPLPDPDERRKNAGIILLAIVVLIMAAWLLRETYMVTMPLAFGFFLTVLVYPIHAWLRERLPEQLSWLSLALTMLVIVAVLAAGAGAVWLSVEMVSSKSSEYAETFREQYNSFFRWAEQSNLPLDEEMVESSDARNRVMQMVTTAVTSIWTVLAMLVLVFFLTLLMLIEAGHWRVKAQRAFADHKETRVLDVVGTVAVKVRQYLWIRTIVSTVSGVSAGLWLWLIGVDFALVWGLLTFLLNYVPNIGSIIAVFPPTAMAFIQMGPVWGLVALGGLTAIEQIIGNYIDPRLQGRALDLSPIVVLLSILFWGWVWGVAGAVLAVPLTATIVIVCAHVPVLYPIAILLSRTGDTTQLDNSDGNGEDGGESD